MAYKVRNRFASIATNDPENDPTPRVMLERTVRDGYVIWVSTDNPETVIAHGRSARDADNAVRLAYAFPAWEFRMLGYGSHSFRIAT